MIDLSKLKIGDKVRNISKFEFAGIKNGEIGTVTQVWNFKNPSLYGHFSVNNYNGCDKDYWELVEQTNSYPRKGDWVKCISSSYGNFFIAGQMYRLAKDIGTNNSCCNCHVTVDYDSNGIPNSFCGINFDLNTHVSNTQHEHTWKTYIGFTDTFEYCSDPTCNIKRNEVA